MKAIPSLRQQFEAHFSRSVFQTIEGEQRIIGKWGQITQFDDGTFDVWFVGQNLQPLTAQRLTRIAQNFPRTGRLTMLDGEAYTQGRGKDFVLDLAPLAGV